MAGALFLCHCPRRHCYLCDAHMGVNWRGEDCESCTHWQVHVNGFSWYDSQRELVRKKFLGDALIEFNEREPS